MKKTFPIATIAFLFGTVLGMPLAHAAQNDSQASDAATVPTTDTVTRQPATQEVLPIVDLDDGTLFKVLSAEIAFQRGHWQAAYITLLSLAQQTQDPRLAKRAAEVAMTSRNQAEALNAVRLWTELSPMSEDALQSHIGLLVLNNNTEEIQHILSERLKKASTVTRPILILRMQRQLANLPDTRIAFQLLEHLTTPYKALPETHLALAQSAYANKDHQRARAEAEQAFAMRPSSELAVLTLAQVMPDSNEAAKLIETFLASHPNAHEVRIAYARELVEQQQFEKAIAQFKVLAEKYPQDLTTLYALGVIHVQLKQWGKAEPYLKRYLEIVKAQNNPDVDTSQVKLLLSQIAEEKHDYDGALAWLAQASQGESAVNIGIRRAHIMTKSRDIAGARKVLSQLFKDSDNPIEQQQLIQVEAQILRENDLLNEASQVLQAGLKQFPDNTNLLYDYAMVAEKRQDFRNMESTLRTIIQLAPNMQHAYNALGYSLTERNIRLPEAHTLINKAYRLAPNDPFITDSLGWIEYRMGNLAVAEKHLRRAYDLRPDPEIGTHLGEVLWAQKKFDEAKKIWRDAHKKDPKNDLLKNTLVRLNVQL